jgi:hypothetical protein
MATEHNRCKSKTRSGDPCQCFALDDGYCFAHSPIVEQKRREAWAKGGRNSARIIRLQGLVPPRLITVYELLEKALQEVHSGDLESKQATAMAALARAMVMVLTSGELEERVRKLEPKNRGKMNLEKRIKILEEENEPKIIETWVDLMKCAMSVENGEIGENEKIRISEPLWKAGQQLREEIDKECC